MIERQARLAAAAGAAPIVILVERMPAELSAAIDRLRADRLPITVARSAQEAAEAVDHDARLLLIADGAVVDPLELERLEETGELAVLVVPDSGFAEPYERIDAQSRWGGAAAIDAPLLRETTAMLRDWDLQSTLLRRALQKGARHLAAERSVIIVDSVEDLAGVERQIVSSAGRPIRALADRLLAPIEAFATRLLMASRIPARLIGLSAAGLLSGAFFAFLQNWRWPGLVALLIAAPLEGLAVRLADLRMEEDISRSWWCQAMPLLYGAALLGLAASLSREGGWGMMLLAIVTIAFLVAAGIENEERRPRGFFWLAERRLMALAILPFAAVDFWHGGIAAIFAFAGASFFWAQREAHNPPKPAKD